MDRRRFLKILGTGTAAGVAFVLTSAEEACAPTGSSEPRSTYTPGHPGRTLKPTHDDGKRYRCDNEKPQNAIFFGTEAAQAHKAKYPSHHVHRIS
jgi:hypothetical protein